MARAINIQLIIEEIQSSLEIPSYSEHDKGFDDGLKYVLGLIEEAPPSPPPNEPFTVTEVCPNCESEITMAWSTIDNGYKAFCPICGNRLMLCGECQHGEPSFACDYNGATDTCRHNPPDRRPPEGEGNA